MAALDKPISSPKDTSMLGAFDQAWQHIGFEANSAATFVALRANVAKPDTHSVEQDGSLNFAKAKNIYPEQEALAVAGIGKGKGYSQAQIQGGDDWLDRLDKQLKAA